MKLQILIPQFNESENIIKPLLDSIALQQRIDFNEIGIIICNDGSNIFLSESFLKSYPYKIEYYKEPHLGVSATRNACLKHSTAEYVMFCDADDMFYNMCGLWIIFREINNGEFDSLVSCFVEECRMPDMAPDFITHDFDATFVHGKVHRRQYLIDNNILFNPSLTIHEDSFFNVLAQNCSENVKYCSTPFYLWKWRDESVCRHDPKYILKTYNNMLDSNDALVGEFIQRKLVEKAEFYVCFIIFEAYYTLNKNEWKDINNQEYRDSVEKRFKDYYLKYENIWNSVSIDKKMQISSGVRVRMVNEGMPMETITIEDWLNKITK